MTFTPFLLPNNFIQEFLAQILYIIFYMNICIRQSERDSEKRRDRNRETQIHRDSEGKREQNGGRDRDIEKERTI